MNKLRYRLVFNKARGMLMAVHEHARSQGKAPGETAPGAVRTAAPPLRPLALLLVTGLGGLLLSGAAVAQIIADPNAPGTQRATILNTANGVLQVNVQTPSAAGVSRNVYAQFDVPKAGAILNNARTDAQTQLGGWVQANPWMKDGSARVILNEVNSSNPSRIQGFIEVAGARAETVIANPAGIVVDGGGFINVSRATLTTGTPLLNDGQLTGFDVRRGQIVITGAGLNATQTDYTALIARSVDVNAGLWARQLEVVGGAGHTDYAGTPGATLTALAGEGEAPRFAIDVAQLGGMYANHIWLVGTEAGVGVRNAGEIGAAAGDLVVTSSGRLENRGSMEASEALALSADSLHNTGQLATHGDATMAIAATLDNRGGSIEAGRLELAAATLLNRDGSIVQTGVSALDLSAQRISNDGGTLGQAAAASATTPTPTPADPVPAPKPDVPATPGSDDATPPAPADDEPGAEPPADATPAPITPGTIRSTTLDNDGGLITASGGVGVQAAEFLNHNGKAHLDSLGVNGASFDNRDGSIQIKRTLDIATDSLVNRKGTLLVGGAATVDTGVFDNVDGTLQAGRFALQAKGLDNTRGTLRHTSATASQVTVAGSLIQQDGVIDAAGAFTLQAGSIDGAEGVINVTGDLDLTSGRTDVTRGDWRVGGDARIVTGALDVSGGALSVGGDLSLDSASIVNRDGRIAAAGAATLHSAGAVDNTDGLVQSGAVLVLEAGGALLNRAGTVEAVGEHATLDVQARTIDNTAGRLVNNGDGAARIAADRIASNGVIGGNGDVAIAATRLDNATGGRIVAARDLALDIDGALANAGNIASGADMAVRGGQATLDNTGSMLAGRDLAVDNKTIVNRGTIATASGGHGSLKIDTGSIDNARGTLQSDADAALQVGGRVDNADGTIRAATDLVLEAGGDLANDSGLIAGGERIDIAAGSIANLGGRIVATGQGDSAVRAKGSIENGGVIGAQGSLALAARNLDNLAQGEIAAHGNLTLDVSARLSNIGRISSGGTLTWEQRGAALENRGSIVAGGDMRMRVDTIDNQSGAISTQGGSMALAANALDNRGGRVMSGRDAALDIRGDLDNDAGLIQAAGALRMDAGANLSNRAGAIEALGPRAGLSIDAGAIDNTAGRIVNVGQGATEVGAAGHIVNTGLIAGNGDLLLSALTTQTSGEVRANGAMTLAVGELLDNSGIISAAHELGADEAQGALRNSGTVVAGGNIDLRLQALDNTKGRLATAQDSQADLQLDVEQLVNTDGAIMADRDAALIIKGDLDNTRGLVQAQRHLALDAGGTLDNTRGDIEALAAASTLELHAGAVRNEGGRIVNVGSGDSAVRADTTLDNSGLIAGNGKLTVEARDARNSAAGNIASGAALALAVHGSLDNAGTISSRATLEMDAPGATVRNSGAIVSQGDATLHTGALDNDGGQIVTAAGAGAGIALQAASLSNLNGRIMADNALELSVAQALDNTRGALQGVTRVAIEAGATVSNDAGVIEATGPEASLTLATGAIANGSGRIVNVGTGATSIVAAGHIDSNGLIAGNGTLDLAADTLLNDKDGTIASGDAMALTLGTALENRGAVNSGATLDIAAETASVRNSGLVVANGALTLRSATFDNDDGQLATANGSGAALRIDAAAISNRKGMILSDADAVIASRDGIDNRAGTLQAAGSLAIEAAGQVDNDAGVIEALALDATLALQAGSLDNGSGRLVNVGSGATTLILGAMTNAGLVAGNGEVTIAADSIDNRSGGTAAAGRGLAIDAGERFANAGTVSSHDDLILRAATASVRNSGQIVSGANATVDAATFDNGGGQLVTLDEGGGDIVLRSGDFTNASGAIVAAGAGRVTVDGTLDNSRGTIRATRQLVIDAGAGLRNDAGAIEASGADATLDVQVQAIDNGSGRLVNAGSGDTRITSATRIDSHGLVAGNGKLDLIAEHIANGAGGTIASGAAMDLHATQSLDNAGSISSAGTLTVDQAAAHIANSGKMVAGERLLVRAETISNDGGQMATAGGADIVLDSATELSNRGGAIAAAGDATLTAAGAIDNSGGQVQTPGRLVVQAGGALVNTGGAFEASGAASTLDLQAASIATTGRIVNAGSGATSIVSASTIVNGGTIGGNGRLDLHATTLDSSAAGTIVAGTALELDIRQRLQNAGSISSGGTLRFDQAGASFANSGQIGAGGALTLHAATVDNGGALYTAGGSGASIALTASRLTNLGGKVAADGRLDVDVTGSVDNGAGTLHGGRGLALDVGGALVNGSGAIEAAAGALDIHAASLSSSGRIVNGGSGDTRVTATSGIDNSGAIAGNGALTLDTTTLRNRAGGQIGAGRALELRATRELDNAGSISSTGTLRFEQARASFSNRGQVDAGGEATFVAASFNNDGGRISTVKGSGADIDVRVPGMSNVGGAILADGKASFALDGALDNRGGTLQGGSALTLTTPGAIGNDGGAIEAVGANATLTLEGATIDNGKGRIANLGNGETRLTSQGGIVSDGAIAAMGNLVLNAQELRNGAAGTVAAGGNLTLALNQQWINQGKVNSGGTLTFDQAGAVFVNSGQVLAGGNMLIKAQQVNNDGGSLGTGNGSNADLALTTGQLSNTGGRIATDRDLSVVTRTVSGMGDMFGGRDLALSMEGDYVHGASQQFQSNRDLSLTVTGNITNTAAFQAGGKLSLSGQQVSNQSGAVIEAQAVAIDASGNLDNAGEIQATGALDIAAANVRNTGAIIGGDVTLATGNLDNTGSAALIGATHSLALGVDGTLNNVEQATLYSSGDLEIRGAAGGATGLVNNHSSTIEAGGNLAMNVGTLRNERVNVRIEQVTTVDETVSMSLPSWYHHGDNHEEFDTKAANYMPREVYFVHPDDILEETPYVTPDGYTITRAVIRTHANDSVFLVAATGLHTAEGNRERLYNSNGTKVIYYFEKAAVANPDQDGDPGATDAGMHTVTRWHSELAFSSDYGSCNLNCYRLITQPDYDDPVHTILRHKLEAVKPEKDRLEIGRDAHHTAVEDRVAPGSGPAAQILSGGNMTLNVGSALDNLYGEIRARGTLTTLGTSNIRNVGGTLYRKHNFDGTWYTAAGDAVKYVRPMISEVIGSAGGILEGSQGVNITGRSFSNVDVTAGTAGNIRDSVQVIGSGQSGANAAGANAATGNGGGAVNGNVRGGAGGNGAVIAGAQSAGGGSALEAAGQSGASGIRNGLAAGGAADASGASHDVNASGATDGSGAGNGLATSGAAEGSGAANDGRIGIVTQAGAGAVQLGDVRSSGGAAAGQDATGVRGAAIGDARQVAPGGLFLQNPDVSGDYLFETRPQFAKQDQWISSDYLLNQLSVDPTTVHKRLGDGFYEQRLVREQLSELTGRSSTAGASDDSIYKELLSNGASAAHEFNLRPGIALSADQVARLTSDIVWMVNETVQLPDGSIETVLVPKVYVAHVGKDNLQPGGALVTGNGVTINVTESIANLGGVIDGGNGRTVLVAGQDIVNQGGAITGGDVALQAGRDIRNESLVVNSSWSTNQNGGSFTSLSNEASIKATGQLVIDAGRDLADLAGKITAGTDAVIQAGNAVSFDTLKTGSTYQSQIGDMTQNDRSITNQLSRIDIGGDLKMTAGGDLNLTGTQVAIGTGGKGNAFIAAGGDVNIKSVIDEVNTSQYNDPASKMHDRQVHANQTVVGAGVNASGSLGVSAGTGGAGSINIVASGLSAGDALQVTAADDVNVLSAQERHLSDTAITRSSSSMLRGKTTHQSDYVDISQAVASSLSGKTVDIAAGKDINVRGSAIAGEGDVDLAAGGSVNIIAATSTVTEKHHKEVKETGFLSGGGFGISYGERTTTTDQSRDGTTQSGQSRSMVGSVDGNLTVKAGDAIKVSGSDLHAGKDMTLDGRSVTIDPGKDDVHDKFKQSTVQDGLTLAVGGTVVNAIQTMQSVKDAASQSKDGRVQALAAATAALAAKNAASDIAQNGVNVSISLTVGHSESHTERTGDNLTHVGSTLNAGDNLTIRATGGGADSNINIIGSDVNAGGNIKLKADNEVNLVAAQDQESQHTDTSSMSASAGVGASIGSNGTSIGFTASVSVGKGKEDGSGTTQLNTHVAAGNQLDIESGADTNIKGAVASGKQVVAQVGGDLNIESLQDTAKFDSKNQSLGVSGTFGAGVSASGSFTDSKLSSDYASVQEQSGIRAGADGFQLVVKGNTDLKGAVIASSQEAIEAGENSLTTGSLTVSDIENHADYKGHSVGLSGGVGTKGDSRDAAPDTSGVASDSWKWMQTGGSGMNAPVAVAASDDASSTTRSGISGGVVTITNGQQQQELSGKTAEQMLAELNRDVSNEKDTSGRLENNFDQASIQAGFEIVGALGSEVSTFLADKAREIDRARSKADELDATADQLLAKAAGLADSDEKSRLLELADTRRQEAVDSRYEAITLDDKWGAGGTYRQVATAFTAAASGNVNGAANEFVQRGVVNWVQANAAVGIKNLAEEYGIAEGSPTHAALHAVSSCVGAGATGSNCGSAAISAASATLITSLLSELDQRDLTNEQKESRSELVQSLITGAAVAAGGAVVDARNAAEIELENNSMIKKKIDSALKNTKNYVAETGKDGLRNVVELLEKLEIGALEDRQKQVGDFLLEKGSKGGLSEAEISALAVLYAANEALFPTNLIDFAGGKSISGAGKLIKTGHRANEAVAMAKAADKVETVAKTNVNVTSGGKGNWSKDLNKPEPDKIYNVDNRYLYHTDSLGRVEKVEGALSPQAFDRNKYQQCKAGKCGDLGDEGGHLIASIFSGPGEKLNIVPMNGNLNKGEWKKLENEWANALADNKPVKVSIQPIYNASATRPDEFVVIYQVGSGRPRTSRLRNSPGGI